MLRALTATLMLFSTAVGGASENKLLSDIVQATELADYCGVELDRERLEAVLEAAHLPHSDITKAENETESSRALPGEPGLEPPPPPNNPCLELIRDFGPNGRLIADLVRLEPTGDDPALADSVDVVPEPRQP